MTLEVLDPPVDRRKSQETSITQLVSRLESRMRRAYACNDVLFQGTNHKKGRWQTNFSLLNHCINVGRIAELKAKLDGASVEEEAQYWLAGLGHDIGKVNPIFFNIWRKDETLTPAELAKMRRHPEKSESLFLRYTVEETRASDTDFVRPIARAIRTHHESWHGDELSRVLQLSDMWQSGTEERRRQEGAQKTHEEMIVEVRDKIETTLLPFGYRDQRKLYLATFEKVEEAIRIWLTLKAP